MDADHHVDSARNPLIKALLRLKDRRGRESAERFLVEGIREATRALDAQVQVEHLLLCPQLLRPADSASLERRVRAAGGEIVTTSLEAFQRLSFRAGPDGVMAVAVAPARGCEDVVLPAGALILVVDGLEKPGNIGALLRTADAVGVDAVFLTGEGTDLYNPNVIRASMGSVFTLPIVRAQGDQVRAKLAEEGVRIVATSPAAVTSHWDADYTGSIAVVLGAEHAGLEPAWLEGAHAPVRIPMRAQVADSLNVSVAGAVILYEALRQRRQTTSG